jgi:hypothetical protein
MVNLRIGFQMENPRVFIPWGKTREFVFELFGDGCQEITPSYLVTECVSLSGLAHSLGLRFESKSGSELHLLEFFQKNDNDLDISFPIWQKHLIDTFGEPHKTSRGDTIPGNKAFSAFAWEFDDVDIKHYVQYRFGPEEKVVITKHFS